MKSRSDEDVTEAPTGGEPQAGAAEEGAEPVLEGAVLELPYIPDFLIEDLRLWFFPSRENPREVYHELSGRSAETWASYYSSKGWKAYQADFPGAEGPYRVDPETVWLDLLEGGWFRPPRPQFRFERGGAAYPIVSLERRRPINPWKPNYIQALNFIKRYEWPRPLPARVRAAIWEIEECGQIAGSTSWRNAERILRRSASPELLYTLADIFFNRPEDYPLGSEVYLRVLGSMGAEGFEKLRELADHPITRKRLIVARTLGELRDQRGVDTLLRMLEDEDPGVRTQALRSLARVGVGADHEEGQKKLRAILEDETAEMRERLWAAAALIKGGDAKLQKFLIEVVKEDPRPLDDLGELGDVLADLELIDAVPFLIQRLKSGSRDLTLDAVDALGKLTGLKVDYAAEREDEPQLRREAIRAYQRWWDEEKRRRSARRRKKS